MQGLNDPINTQDKAQDRQSYYPADQTPRREGGDDSLAEAHPEDPRDDEKVIVNNPRERKNEDSPSHTVSDMNRNSNNDRQNI